MAKKKTSVKKANLKKDKKKVTKTQTKKVVKKVVKKAVKKTVKKTTPKVAPKKAVKASPKKTAKKATKKVTKQAKVSSPKKAVQSTPKASAKTTAVKTTVTKETKIAVSNFVTPLDDRLIVRTANADRMTAGGLYIPDTVADVSGNFQGDVVAVGRGHQNKKGHVKPMDVQVGDKVVFSEYSGSKIKLQGEELTILRESEVLGVISK